MAQSLDLEEQEQLDQLKHFWNRYGNAITWGLILVFGAVAAWNGWQYWQRKQASGAAMLYDEIERAVSDKDAERVERALADMKDKFARTTYAHQGALLAARGLTASGKGDAAKAALVWTAEQSGDEGLQTIARLRLAALAMDASAPEEALKWLQAPTVPEFAGLVADRLGDVYLAQGKKTEARAEFEKAYQLLEAGTEYRQLVEVKLNALGVDPQAAAPAAVTK
jgi:predicted negative regulator of RcsB-dependent stress response